MKPQKPGFTRRITQPQSLHHSGGQKKERVMIQFDQKVLERVDTAAERRGISRSAWIQFVVSQALDKGEG